MIIIDKEMLSEMEENHAIIVKINLLEEEANSLCKALPNNGYVLVLVEETKQIISCKVLGIAKTETEPKLYDAGFQALYLRLYRPLYPANVKTDAIAKAVLKNISDKFSQESVVE